MRCDLHIHSEFSHDSCASLEDICAAALQNGVGILSVTDHCEIPEVPDNIGSYYLPREEARIRAIRAAQAAHPELTLLYGIELGNPWDVPERTEAFLRQRQDLDFVIGAVHFLSDLRDIYLISYDSPQIIDAMFRDHFECMLKLVRFGHFDTLAHLDYPLRKLQGKVDACSVAPWRELIDPVLRELVRRDIALELNTRGTYDWQGRPGPEEWVLRRYRELGGQLITIGSDAHSPRWVGAGFDEAASLLRKCGFDSFTIYKKRLPVQIPLTGTQKG